MQVSRSNISFGTKFEIYRKGTNLRLLTTKALKGVAAAARTIDRANLSDTFDHPGICEVTLSQLSNRKRGYAHALYINAGARHSCGTSYESSAAVPIETLNKMRTQREVTQKILEMVYDAVMGLVRRTQGKGCNPIPDASKLEIPKAKMHRHPAGLRDSILETFGVN